MSRPGRASGNWQRSKSWKGSAHLSIPPTRARDGIRDPAGCNQDRRTDHARHFRWQNFPDAMNRGSRPGVGASFWVYFKNSLIIAFFSIIGTLLSNTPVAYAFARIKFPGRDLLFVLVLATMMLPFQVTMIPHLSVLQRLPGLGRYLPAAHHPDLFCQRLRCVPAAPVLPHHP